MRYYLLDKITQFEHNKNIEGVKCWTLSDPIFEQHFPGIPIVPGALLIESMAQLLGYLINISYLKEFNERGIAFLSIVHKAKFKNWVRPGDKTILKGSLTTIDLDRGSGKVEIFVEDKLVAEAALSFIIMRGNSLEQKHIDKLTDYYNIISFDLKK